MTLFLVLMTEVVYDYGKADKDITADIVKALNEKK